MAEGGFHLGLEQAGFKFDKTYHSEIDKYAKSVYQKHFPESEDLGDVTRIDVSRFPKGQYIITGGWPCQDNSIAGKRKGQSGGLRSSLFSEIIRILRELISVGSSVIFIGENVKGLYSVNNKMDFLDTITRLTDLDTSMPQLNLEVQLLNTRWFLPQNRERIYFVGYSGKRSGRTIFPIGESSEVHQKSNGTEQRKKKCASTIRPGLNGFPGNSETYVVINTREGLKQTRNEALCIDRNYHKGMDNHGQRTMIQVGNVDQKGHNSLWGRVYSPEGCSATLNAKGGGMGAKTGLYEVKAVITPDRQVKGQNGRKIKELGEPMFTIDSTSQHEIEISTAQPRCGDPKKGGTEPLRNKEYCFTIDRSPHIVNRIRRLTPIECERLQGFPDNWTKYGKDYELISDTQRYKMIGNSVSVPVVKAIAERIKSLPNEGV